MSIATHVVTCLRGRAGKLRLVIATENHCPTSTPAQTNFASKHVVLMSFLRRRFGGSKDDDSPIESREPSPAPGQTRPSNLRVITAEQLHTLKKKGKSKRGYGWVFGLGGIFGLVVAGFFASSNEMIDLASLENMSLDSIRDALPASFITSAQQLQVSSI